MRYLACLVVAASTVAWVQPVHGQFFQLPSFDYFSVRTSVMVPDQGGANLGGVRRSAQRSTSAGLPGWGPLMGNRAIQSSSGAAGVSVRTTVIDLDAMDRAVLAKAAREKAAGLQPGQTGENIARRLNQPGSGRSSDSPALMSVAEIKRQNAERKGMRQQEARALFERGEVAAASGQRGAAKIFYQMAQRRGDATLRQQVATRLTELQTAVDRSKSAR